MVRDLLSLSLLRFQICGEVETGLLFAFSSSRLRPPSRPVTTDVAFGKSIQMSSRCVVTTGDSPRDCLCRLGGFDGSLSVLRGEDSVVSATFVSDVNFDVEKKPSLGSFAATLVRPLSEAGSFSFVARVSARHSC